MSHVPGVRTISIVTLALAAFPACDKDKFHGPESEVKKSDVKLDLPNVPAFDLPPPAADGSHAVKELRVKGKKLFGTDVQVHGFVTWVYDCPTAIRKPGETDQQVQDRIDSPKLGPDHKTPIGDPTLCEGAKFYIGDTATTPLEKSLWVVEVPRPYNRVELHNQPDKTQRTDPLRCEPKEDPKKNMCGPYDVGDEVVITGTLQASSAHATNSEGLIVYKKMKNVTKSWETPDIEPPPGAGSAAPPPKG